MGFLDKFKNNEAAKKRQNTVSQSTAKQELPFDIKYTKNSEGKLQIDFYDKNAEFRQFYDTTRLIIDDNISNVGNKALRDCRISWYGQDDAIMFDREGNEISSRTAYRNITTNIDFNLLQNDPNYCIALMKSLLNKKRVEEYLNRGMNENPEVPCGKYVGEIRKIDNMYKKVFDKTEGERSHYSQEMINVRREFSRTQEEKRQQKILEKREMMAKLQSEVDELSK